MMISNYFCIVKIVENTMKYGNSKPQNDTNVQTCASCPDQKPLEVTLYPSNFNYENIV